MDYVAHFKAELEAGRMTSRQVWEGAITLQQTAEQRQSLQGMTPHQLAVLAREIREMVAKHDSAYILAPLQGQAALETATQEQGTPASTQPVPRRVSRDEYMAQTWGQDEDEPDYNEKLEEEALRQMQAREGRQ